MLTRRTVIEVALETNYGTDPATGFSPVLAWDVEPDIRGEVLERPILRDTLSPISHVIGMKDIALNFKTELKTGGGNGGTVPEMGNLLQGCAYGSAAHTDTAPIIYSPISEENKITSVSLYLYKDGNKHKITGARGTFRLNMEAGKFGVVEWEFQGLYNAVIASTVPDVSAASLVKPPIVYNSNFQIGGFSPVCSACNIDVANEVVKRADLNSTAGVHSFRISGRKPKMEFNADAVVESSNPFWGDWSGDVLATFAIVVGTGDYGNQVKIDGFFQYETNKYGDADGVGQYEVVAALVSSDTNTQNDELVLTFT